jgi:hypothetical protein
MHQYSPICLYLVMCHNKVVEFLAVSGYKGVIIHCSGLSSSVCRDPPGRHNHY